MVDTPAIRRMATALPEARDASSERALAFEVGGKGFAWTYMERLAPGKPRQPRLDVLAVRCPLEKKEMLIAAAPERFFDDDHYRGYPAVLVRLARIDEDELRALLADGWALSAPRSLVRRYGHPSQPIE
jgi:hypothetical protein